MTDTPLASGHPARARLWLCLDLAALDEAALLRRARSILENVGADIPVALWLRNLSSLHASRALGFAREARALARDWEASLVVGERADLAVLSEADALHVTGRSPDVRDVARFLDERAPTSLALTAAVHDPAQVDAHAPRCEVLLASPFGPVPEKNPPLRAAGLTAMISRAPARTFVALGGIDSLTTAKEALGAGAHGIAVRRPLLDEQPLARLAPVLDALRAAPLSPPAPA
jgi:thiamine monophosphate synthase